MMNKKDYELDSNIIGQLVRTVDYFDTVSDYFNMLVDRISTNTDTETAKSLLDEYTRVSSIIDKLHMYDIDEHNVIGEYSDDRLELMNKDDIIEVLTWDEF